MVQLLKVAKQMKLAYLSFLVLPLMSFNTTHKQGKNISKLHKQALFVSSAEDLLCLSISQKKQISSLKTKKINVKSNGEHRAHHIHRARHIMVDLPTHVPNPELLQRERMDTSSHSATHQPIARVSGAESQKSRLSFQAKAKKGEMALRPEIQNALRGLVDFEAPAIVVTSTVRNWGGKGHRCGKAIDLNYTKTLTSWLCSKSGTDWLNTYNLEFFIEDYKKSTKEMLNPDEEAHFRWIGWSTGLHIHVNLKSEK